MISKQVTNGTGLRPLGKNQSTDTHGSDDSEPSSIPMLKGIVGIVIVCACPFLLWFIFVFSQQGTTDDAQQNTEPGVGEHAEESTGAIRNSLNESESTSKQPQPSVVNRSLILDYDDPNH